MKERFLRVQSKGDGEVKGERGQVRGTGEEDK